MRQWTNQDEILFITRGLGVARLMLFKNYSDKGGFLHPFANISTEMFMPSYFSM